MQMLTEPRGSLGVLGVDYLPCVQTLGMWPLNNALSITRPSNNFITMTEFDEAEEAVSSLVEGFALGSASLVSLSALIKHISADALPQFPSMYLPNPSYLHTARYVCSIQDNSRHLRIRLFTTPPPRLP
ncbi:hypothetical protein N7G274_005875 [Stereocaulon virgatum]|uniref:Uncharacterized protein n=1 Tax=Stereocaulon virgatum TaxID=373712 RepID=A0ABR4A8U4_9LECA